MSAPFQDITILSSDCVERDQAVVLCVEKTGFERHVINYGDLNDYFKNYNVVVAMIATERWQAISDWNNDVSASRALH